MYNQSSGYEKADTHQITGRCRDKKNLHHPMISLNEEKKKLHAHNNSYVLARTKVMLICDLRFRIPYAICDIQYILFEGAQIILNLSLTIQQSICILYDLRNRTPLSISMQQMDLVRLSFIWQLLNYITNQNECGYIVI